MRGQTIYNQLTKNDKSQIPPRKGRNNSLISLRNDCLLTRYYYYSYYKNKCYEDIIRLLVLEFFLSPTTVTIIIQRSAQQLQALKQRAPVLHYMQAHWPHLKW